MEIAVQLHIQRIVAVIEPVAICRNIAYSYNTQSLPVQSMISYRRVVRRTYSGNIVGLTRIILHGSELRWASIERCSTLDGVGNNRALQHSRR